jgi:hypothetical protein
MHRQVEESEFQAISQENYVFVQSMVPTIITLYYTYTNIDYSEMISYINH